MEHKDYTEIHPGTYVTRTILNNLGSPDDALKIIHIAGTNGKGSTAEFFTQILIAAGKKVGTFTSPAVYDFYDQFRIDGVPLSETVAEKYFERALAASEGLNPTDFEIQTAGVLLAFKEEGCEWAVVECGMGGLNDATNAINKKELAVITSISLEHTEYLGDTIAKICVQKTGIIKDCPVVINGFQPVKAAENYLKNYGGIYAEGVVKVGRNYLDNTIFSYSGLKFFLCFSNSQEQAFNAATAIEGARLLGFSDKDIYKGLSVSNPLGRVEEISVRGKKYILDGGHNICAVEPLFERLCSPGFGKITIIFGCLKDKDIDGILLSLLGIPEKIIAVECPSPRTRSLEETAEICRKYYDNVSIASSVSNALSKARTDTVVVCGSFTLLKEAKLWIEKRQ